MSTIVDVGYELTGFINSSDVFAEADVVFSVSPNFTLSDTREQKVIVIPVDLKIEVAGRNRIKKVMKFEVGVVKLTNDIDGQVSLLDRLSSAIAKQEFESGARVQSVDVASIFDPERLEKSKQYLGVIDVVIWLWE